MPRTIFHAITGFSSAGKNDARREASRSAACNTRSGACCAEQQLIMIGICTRAKGFSYALPVSVLRHCSKAGNFAVISSGRRRPYHHQQHCAGMEKQTGSRTKPLTPLASYHTPLVSYHTPCCRYHPLRCRIPLLLRPLVITPYAVWQRSVLAPW